MNPIQFNLPQDRIPRAWYNILADLPEPMAPPLHPGTLQPIGPDDLAPLFPMALIMQEVSTEREIEIPDPVRQVYAQWRPSPLFRARRLEKALDTPAKIYYKYEGVSPAGCTSRIRQCRRPITTRWKGPGGWRRRRAPGSGASALAMACAFFGLGVQGLHGARELRSKALSTGADGGVWRAGHGQPEYGNRVGLGD